MSASRLYLERSEDVADRRKRLQPDHGLALSLSAHLSLTHRHTHTHTHTLSLSLSLSLSHSRSLELPTVLGASSDREDLCSSPPLLMLGPICDSRQKLILHKEKGLLEL